VCAFYHIAMADPFNCSHHFIICSQLAFPSLLLFEIPRLLRLNFISMLFLHALPETAATRWREAIEDEFHA
jgi:hypothetical protein